MCYLIDTGTGLFDNNFLIRIKSHDIYVFSLSLPHLNEKLLYQNYLGEASLISESLLSTS